MDHDHAMTSIERREAAIGTRICADCDGPAKLDEGLCLACREPRRTRALEATNPYKKVWNTVEDEEAYLLASVKNNTLFTPTPAIMAERHRATARHQRKRAAVGRIPSPWSPGVGTGRESGRKASREAVIQDRLVAAMDAYDEKIKKLKRPTEYWFTVMEDEESSSQEAC